MWGIGLYVLASLLCASAGGILALVTFRMLQAAGAAAASALSMAICRDVFEGRARQQILAYISVIVALAPMLSPIVGGGILTWLSWPWIFITQGTIGLLAWAGVYRMHETLREPNRLNPALLFGRYGRLARNGRYMSCNLVTAISVCPMFAFIAGCSDIYITRFDLSEQAFGFFFAFNALALMCGAFTCARLVRRLAAQLLMSLGFLGIFCGGLGMLLSAGGGPWHLALSMFGVTFCIGLSRPLSNNFVLEQVDADVGTASSFLVFTYFVVGALAMWLISLNWADKIRVLAIFAMVAGALTLATWQVLLRTWMRQSPISSQ
jgi:DHA1 family bicyclomycin/chloramphenicol resistance-like MFS transporter